VQPVQFGVRELPDLRVHRGDEGRCRRDGRSAWWVRRPRRRRGALPAGSRTPRLSWHSGSCRRCPPSCSRTGWPRRRPDTRRTVSARSGTPHEWSVMRQVEASGRLSVRCHAMIFTTRAAVESAGSMDDYLDGLQAQGVRPGSGHGWAHVGSEDGARRRRGGGRARRTRCRGTPRMPANADQNWRTSRPRVPPASKRRLASMACSAG
jgi:hypothetical protein